jgi:hypothetical protein
MPGLVPPCLLRHDSLRKEGLSPRLPRTPLLLQATVAGGAQPSNPIDALNIVQFGHWIEQNVIELLHAPFQAMVFSKLYTYGQFRNFHLNANLWALSKRGDMIVKI